jgi:hypothetical protein
MRAAERATPVAAMIAALSTLACCLPLGFLGAVGLAGLSVWAQSLHGWFLVLAITCCSWDSFSDIEAGISAGNAAC